MLLIASIINAFGVTVFLYPVKLYDSGITGIESDLTIRYEVADVFHPKK